MKDYTPCRKCKRIKPTKNLIDDYCKGCYKTLQSNYCFYCGMTDSLENAIETEDDHGVYELYHPECFQEMYAVMTKVQSLHFVKEEENYEG